MSDITDDKWFKEGFESFPFHVERGFNISSEQSDVVLAEMAEIGLDVNLVRKSLKEDLYDSQTATFYLLCDRKFRFKQEAPDVQGVKAIHPKIEPLGEELLQKVKMPLETSPKESSEVAESFENTKLAELPSLAKPQAIKERRATVSVTRKLEKEISNAPMQGNENASIADSGVKTLNRPISRSSRPPSASRKPSRVALQADSIANEPIIPSIQNTLPPIAKHQRSQTLASEISKSEETVTYDTAKRLIDSQDEPRSARFTMSLKTTTDKSPVEIVSEITNVLDDLNIYFENKNTFYRCKMDQLEFELEVCKVPNLHIYCIRYKRVSGASWTYKETLGLLLSKLQL
jgi:MAP/microtubule affinity-regulating kinase